MPSGPACLRDAISWTMTCLDDPIVQTGHTPLMVASMHNRTDVVKVLLKGGASLESRNLVCLLCHLRLAAAVGFGG